MITKARWSALLCSLAWIAVTGCSNPSADVTAAKVGDARPIPASAEAPADPAGTEAADTEPPAAPASGEVVAFDQTTSSIDFVGSKLVGGSHDGGFESFDGQFVLAPGGDELQAVSVTIDMDSTWSDTDRLTTHLKNEDFFEVETYPTSSFVSTEITPDTTAGGTHEVTGNLTMHGVTKSVSFPATLAVSEESVSLKSEFKLDRTLWGIVYNAEHDVRDRVINKDVVIRLTVDAPRGASAPAADAGAEAGAEAEAG